MDGVVAIDRDCTEVEYGRGAGEHVEREPGVAEDRAERPVADDSVGYVVRHDEDGYGQVGAGQGDDVEVLYSSKRFVREY